MENKVKIKLLRIYEILRNNTDEHHMMTTYELIAALAQDKIKADHRSVKSDIETLNEFGYEIMCEKIGNQNWYYVADRLFSDAEIKMLIDAVQAANFIPEGKTDELTRKLAHLSGLKNRTLKAKNLICYNVKKHSNENIWLIVETITEALVRNRKISFQYYRIDENKNLYTTHPDGYVTNPVALVYDADNYYLVTYNEKYDRMVNYRVDRMKDCSVLEEPAHEKAVISRKNLHSYKKESFKMYNGAIRSVTLVFDKELVPSIVDKFGEKVIIKKSQDGRCFITEDIKTGPTFYSWVFGAGKKMEIADPEEVREEYLGMCREVLASSVQRTVNSEQ